MRPDARPTHPHTLLPNSAMEYSNVKLHPAAGKLQCHAAKRKCHLCSGQRQKGGRLSAGVHKAKGSATEVRTFLAHGDHSVVQ